MRRKTLANKTGAVLAALLSLAIAGPALAQADKLDKVRFVEGLRKEGLGDLLKRYAQTETSKDPAFLRQVLINQLLLDYETKTELSYNATSPEEAAELRTSALADFDKAMDERRKLIKDFYSHEERPLWQTDLAEMLLIEYVRTINNNAAEFYEFGVPSKEQREAFEKYIPEALAEISDADYRLFALQRELPMESDHVAKRVNTLLWQRMYEQYYQMRTPYYMAIAAYYASLLPESDPFWKTKNPKIAKQRTTYKEERDRLLREETIEKLERFFKNDAQEFAELRRIASSLTGRAMIARGNAKDGLVKLDQAIQQDAIDLNNLIARMGKIQGLAADPKTIALANSDAATLGNLPLPTANLAMKVLVTDLLHRVMVQQANALTGEAKLKALENAYRPYVDIINDPAFDEAKREMLRLFVYRRWENSISPTVDINTLPAIVVAAIGDMALMNGQNLNFQAANENNSDKQNQLRAQAAEKFRRCIDVSAKLLDRKGLDPVVAGSAMYNAAFALFMLEPGNTTNELLAGNLLLKMSQTYPEHPNAQAAAVLSVNLLRPIFIRPQHPPATDYLYRQAIKNLVTRYPTINSTNRETVLKAFNDERLIYGVDVAARERRWLDAAEVLAGITPDSPSYPLAQRDMMIYLWDAYKDAAAGKAPAEEPDPKPVSIPVEVKYPAIFTEAPAPLPKTTQATPDAKALAEKTIAAAETIMNNSDQWIADARGDVEERAAKDASGWARLVRADMATEYEKQFDLAIQTLANFEQTYQGEVDLIRVALTTRIFSYFKANKIDEAVVESRKMMREYPDDAAYVIDKVLNSLNAQILALRVQAEAALSASQRQELTETANTLSVASMNLAQLLLDWALNPNRNIPLRDQMPYRLVYARALQYNNQSAKALEILLPLKNDDAAKGSGLFLFTLSEIYYAAALDIAKTDKPKAIAMLEKDVLPTLSSLTKNIPADTKTKIYPDLFWQTWLLLLKTCESLAEIDNSQGGKRFDPYKAQIPLIVKQLTGTDPNLGGPRFKDDFTRMANKYATGL